MNGMFDSLQDTAFLLYNSVQLILFISDFPEHEQSVYSDSKEIFTVYWVNNPYYENPYIIIHVFFFF